MKSVLGIILISATLTTILFGGFMMSSDSSGHVQCPISVLSGDCANIMNPFSQAISHLNAVIGISIGVAIWPVTLFLILALGIFLSLYAKDYLHAISRHLASDNQNEIGAIKESFLRWLSFLEKRDPLLFVAAKI